MSEFSLVANNKTIKKDYENSYFVIQNSKLLDRIRPFQIDVNQFENIKHISTMCENSWILQKNPIFSTKSLEVTQSLAMLSLQWLSMEWKENKDKKNFYFCWRLLSYRRFAADLIVLDIANIDFALFCFALFWSTSSELIQKTNWWLGMV